MHAAASRSIELNVSYVYTALWTYFDRDNVGLPGLAAWFKKESDEVGWLAGRAHPSRSCLPLRLRLWHV